MRDHPLPGFDPGADKNARGRVLAIGGSRRVPGGLRLTGEAALRAGAGKVQLATVAPLAVPLGIALPEAGIIALDEDPAGEIAAGPARPSTALVEAFAACDAAVIGPAMGCGLAAGRLLDGLAEAVVAGTEGGQSVVLDAACLLTLADRPSLARGWAGRLLLTSHIGEMATMLGCTAARIDADRLAAAREAAQRFDAVIVLKGPTTLITRPDRTMLAYAGGGVGLATGGSGDVLAGLASGLAARGASPWEAAAWAVWLHGEAGRRCAERIGPAGYLARDLLPGVPALLPGAKFI